MSLYHGTFSKIVTPVRAEKNQYLQLFKDRLDPRSFEKSIRIFDERIASIAPSKTTALEFAMLATLVGYNSTCPAGDSNYVWRMVEKASRKHPKISHFMLGTLAQWRFTLEERPWICARRDTGKINSEGEEVYVTIYWVKKENS